MYIYCRKGGRREMSAHQTGKDVVVNHVEETLYQRKSFAMIKGTPPPFKIWLYGGQCGNHG